MSKIGKKPIPIPDDVQFEIEGTKVKVSGPKGCLSREFHPDFDIQKKNGNIIVLPKKKSSSLQPYYGLTRALLANMVKGVSEGYTKILEIVGVGYRAKMSGDMLELSVGFSHSIVYKPPDGVKITVPDPRRITVTGIDKELVGNTASVIRNFKPPEPYKGKGIRYQDEYVRRKQGKRAVATGV
ncbi:MAG: 50S ribosomal protein L6 [bacterium (Candidatus Stahlbacteria) CG08_land_8_20_14_0_20_40_26]|nr:MAG: 50S ribosomal protein L6 [bacterium (Candidatus Stahlbacteria) CG23_combo_of_CG06-09_8_20_14_all_40_9]PIS26854.1 MAG: 50S ribosomal protein L6 [bacterium (Candidatus Stahlbacteria) CG08_land_8_20_14_0_20_40_26]